LKLVKVQSGFKVGIRSETCNEYVEGGGMSENPNVVASGNPNTGANENVRIGEVEKDVKKLKADVDNFMTLKNTVEDLKNTIVDIRSLISESQNPFNLLQLITSEEDLNKVVKAKPIIENKLLAKEQAVGKLEAKGASGAQVPAACEPKKDEAEVGFAVESYVDTKDAADLSAASEIEKPENKFTAEKQVGGGKERMIDNPLEGMGSVNSGSSIVQWVYTMLDLGFDEESIHRICDYCEFSDFMPKGYSEHVSNLVGAVVRARSQNLSAEEVILSIYGAAHATGVKVEPQDLSGLIMRVLKKCKAGEP
jgi:hypothetical protein